VGNNGNYSLTPLLRIRCVVDDSCKESTSLRPKTKTSMTTAAPLTPTSSDWTSVPTDWTTSDDEGGSRPFGLHCGCRWSPNHQTCSAAAAAGGDFRMQAIDVFDDFYDPCQSPVTGALGVIYLLRPRGNQDFYPLFLFTCIHTRLTPIASCGRPRAVNMKFTSHSSGPKTEIQLHV